MTRESIPSMDLYAELEVSRLASVEVIEAAYRTLAKSHHPDVARPQDTERIKRLNEARKWLSDPVRRRRYDAATQSDPKPSRSSKAATGTPDVVERSPWTSTAKAFGPNTDEVRQFLADLRALDEPRARSIRDGRAAIDPIAYAVARHVAYMAGRNTRQDEWLLAHEAASVIARGKLGDSPLGPVVSDVVADIAGAITVRDLIPPRDFEALLQPWNQRGDQTAAGAAVTQQAPGDLPSPGSNGAAVAAPMAARGRVRPGRVGASMLAAPPAVLAIVGLIALASVVLALNGARPEVAVADRTEPPSAGPSLPPPVVAASPLDTARAIASPSSATSSFVIVPSDTPVPEPSTGPGPVSTPRVTARPPATPRPTLVPTPVPTPVPTAVPTAVPTPSAPVFCEVISLIDVNTSEAQLRWSEAQFTGTVVFSPSVPPQYKIGWQSLNAGDIVLCTSGITVQKVAP